MTTIRKAIPADAGVLSELSFRSKQYWGYDDDFMEACRDDLTISAEKIGDSNIYVAIESSTIVGFYELAEDESAWQLHNLFVEPDAIGKGYGKMLWAHMANTASSLGIARFHIHSDPYAEPFYLKRGARRVGEIPSTAIPGRTLPLMEFVLSDAP